MSSIKYSTLYVHNFEHYVFYVYWFETGVHGSLVIKPHNVAAMSGDVVSLSCASDSEDSVAWVAYSPGSAEREYISDCRDLSPSASQYISIYRERKGPCSLRINATRIAAKRYICKEPVSAMEASAELIILGNIGSSLINNSIYTNNVPTVDVKKEVEYFRKE